MYLYFLNFHNVETDRAHNGCRKCCAVSSSKKKETGILGNIHSCLLVPEADDVFEVGIENEAWHGKGFDPEF